MQRRRSKPSHPRINQLTAAGVVTVLLGVAAVGLGMMITRPTKLSTQLEPLEAGRKKYPTNLTIQAPAQEPYKTDLPHGMTAVTYYSEGRKLLAWIILPKFPGRHPAIMFAHRGYALDSRDLWALMPFVNDGYTVMLPAWRGENNNPGNFEMCFGEVADARAAVQYLADRLDIDSKHIYAAGFDTGGTLVMLLAEICPTIRKAAACGGYPNMLAGGPYDHPPFEENSQYELDLRSPANHTHDLKCPLALFYAESDPIDKKFIEQAEAMQKSAKLQGKVLEVDTIPNTNHFTAINHAVPRMLNFFQLN
jgi:dipeptidyl aminopeptidase/acylaminoacyl peptidase